MEHAPINFSQVQNACRLYDIPPSTFGREAVGDPALYADLRQGRRLRARTAAKVAAYLDSLKEREPAPPKAEPELRSFIVYSSVPVGCIAMLVPDARSMPHVRPGECVIIDVADREPSNGEMFVIEWINGERQVIETRLRPVRIVEPDGQCIDTHRWWTEWQMTMRRVDGTLAETMRWSDGPYSGELLASKLVGRVIGILEPDNRHAVEPIQRERPFTEPGFYDNRRMMREGSAALLAAILQERRAEA